MRLRDRKTEKARVGEVERKENAKRGIENHTKIVIEVEIDTYMYT